MGLIIGPRLIIHSGGGGGNKDKWLDPVAAEYTKRTSGGSANVGGKAKIGSIKGRSLVWNQMVKNGDFGTGSTTGWNSTQGLTAVVNNGVCELTKSITTSAYLSQNVSLIEGHKYFVSFELKAYNNKILFFIRDATADQYYARTTISSDFDKFHHIQTTFVAVADRSNAQIRVNDNNNADIQTYYLKNVMLIDLTLLGLESLSADEFAKLYPRAYYASTYTGNNYATFAPRLINNAASAIKTTGFNQWDEVVESGGINRDTGANTNNDNYNRTKNFIPVFPSTSYYLKCPVKMCVIFYDRDKKFISSQAIRNDYFDTPEGTAYIRFRNDASGAWPTYNNDVCLNLSWAGDRNGQYKRYWENTLNLNLTTITGKLDGAGDSVVIFPDGMKSVGSVYDELTKTTATKRIGSQTITGSTGDTITLVGCSADDFLCANDIGTVSDGVLTLTSDVSGEIVYFPLDTPQVFTIDQALNLSYKVDSYGTEERLPEDTASAVNAPIRYDVSYTEPKPSDEKE